MYTIMFRHLVKILIAHLNKSVHNGNKKSQDSVYVCAIKGTFFICQLEFVCTVTILIITINIYLNLQYQGGFWERNSEQEIIAVE